MNEGITTTFYGRTKRVRTKRKRGDEIYTALGDHIEGDGVMDHLYVGQEAHVAVHDDGR